MSIPKLALLALFFGFANCSVFSQTANRIPFDSLGFNNLLEEAKWLCESDEIAWLATDSLKKYGKEELSRLGDLGFCYQDELKNWYISYDKVNNAGQRPLFHYQVDSLYRLNPVQSNNDSTLYHSFTNALAKCLVEMNSVIDSVNIHMNQYIHRLPDKSIEVWILPAFQPSGQAIYGAEWKFHLDSQGLKILDTYSYTSGLKSVWIGQPRELWLNYRDINQPTTGSIYFAWSFKDYFTRIHIATNNSISTLQKNSSGQYSWDYKFNELPVNK